MTAYSIGFDLGDGESTLAFCRTEGLREEPEVYGSSVPTAICRRKGGFKIGVKALVDSAHKRLAVNFKSRPRSSEFAWDNPLLLSFADTLFRQFEADYPEVAADAELFVGCPAGWQEDEIERYRLLFNESEVLPPTSVVPESRAALVQAREHEGLSTEQLRRCLVIDIGSSTTDVSIVEGHDVKDHAGGSDLGLADVDHAIFDELKARYPDPDYLSSFVRQAEKEAEEREEASIEFFIVYLCRTWKEVSFGARRDPEQYFAAWLPSRHLWEILETISVRQLMVEGRPGTQPWLERFERFVQGLAADADVPQPAAVVLTGGGSTIPEIVDIVAAVFPAPTDVRISRDPSVGVAKGLAGYGSLSQRIRRFRDEASALLATPKIRTALRDTYRPFVSKTWEFFGENATAGIWEPMADLWRVDQLRLRTRGNFRVFAFSLYNKWLAGPGAASYAPIIRSFSEALTGVASVKLAEVARGIGLDVDAVPISVPIPLSPSDMSHAAAEGSPLLDGVGWTAQAAVFRGLDRLPRIARSKLGGDFLKAMLGADDLGRREVLELLGPDTGMVSVPEQITERLDTLVQDACQAAVTTILRDLEGLLLDARR